MNLDNYTVTLKKAADIPFGAKVSKRNGNKIYTLVNHLIAFGPARDQRRYIRPTPGEMFLVDGVGVGTSVTRDTLLLEHTPKRLPVPAASASALDQTIYSVEPGGILIERTWRTFIHLVSRTSDGQTRIRVELSNDPGPIQWLVLAYPSIGRRSVTLGSYESQGEAQHVADIILTAEIVKALDECGAITLTDMSQYQPIDPKYMPTPRPRKH